ncbi:iron complex transport system substrate-binding protein [Nocardioides exalbidus]|uniref:Iron complex transport system substrate-binding protein n=1 Tax=Nocardioides exalbidus TaxID=402596 RepID=A0A1H4WGI2_9ACTN|nr:ABC transporter substrate-binding protein [Nocardioides exalbidus]SEC92355.1 iron complex transport system substrate-binding protein [Nocardioides exalbidus]
MPLAPTRITATLLLAGALAACGGEADEGSRPTSSSTGSYPVTVENCGADVTFEADPARVVLLKSSAVPFLHELGVMDRVTARAGQYPADYYDDETLAELDGIPLLTDELDSSGHLQISQEVVISQEPDLVLGQVDNLSRDTLDAVGIPLLEEPALCGTGGRPGFDDVYDQLETYGTVFGREEQAEEAITDLRSELAEIEAEVGSEGSGRTAAVLYPTVGGGTTYAYGTGSMAHPQLEAAGFENVFGDVDERVFEVTLEELLGRDPDVLVLLHSEGDPGPVEQAITDLPGADELTAVRNGDVMTQLFNFTEPPSPLAFDGLARIVERFGPGS